MGMAITIAKMVIHHQTFGAILTNTPAYKMGTLNIRYNHDTYHDAIKSR